MHRHSVAILCLLTVLLLTVAARAEVHMTNTEQGMTGATTVRLVIPSSYTVTIPGSMSIPYGTASTPMTIGVSSMKTGPDQAIRIAVDSARGELRPEDGSASIPYVLLHEGEAFSSALYASAGETQLSLDIAMEDWFEAAAGEYAGTVTFRVSVVSQEVGQ